MDVEYRSEEHEIECRVKPGMMKALKDRMIKNIKEKWAQIRADEDAAIAELKSAFSNQGPPCSQLGASGQVDPPTRPSTPTDGGQPTRPSTPMEDKPTKSQVLYQQCFEGELSPLSEAASLPPSPKPTLKLRLKPTPGGSWTIASASSLSKGKEKENVAPCSNDALPLPRASTSSANSAVPTALGSKFSNASAGPSRLPSRTTTQTSTLATNWHPQPILVPSAPAFPQSSIPTTFSEPGTSTAVQGISNKPAFPPANPSPCPSVPIFSTPSRATPAQQLVAPPFPASAPSSSSSGWGPSSSTPASVSISNAAGSAADTDSAMDEAPPVANIYSLPAQPQNASSNTNSVGIGFPVVDQRAPSCTGAASVLAQARVEPQARVHLPVSGSNANGTPSAPTQQTSSNATGPPSPPPQTGFAPLATPAATTTAGPAIGQGFVPFVPSVPSVGPSPWQMPQAQANPYQPRPEVFQQPACTFMEPQQSLNASFVPPPPPLCSSIFGAALYEIPVARTECALLPPTPEPPRPDILGLSTYISTPSPPPAPIAVEPVEAFEEILAREIALHEEWKQALLREQEMQATEGRKKPEQESEETTFWDVPSKDPYKLVDFRPQESLSESEKRNIKILEHQRREAARAEVKRAGFGSSPRRSPKRKASPERGSGCSEEGFLQSPKRRKTLDNLEDTGNLDDKMDRKHAGKAIPRQAKRRPWGVFGVQYA